VPRRTVRDQITLYTTRSRLPGAPIPRASIAARVAKGIVLAPFLPNRAGNVLLPRMRLGRYQLLVPVSSGGMGEVWAARLHGRKGFSKLVALKTMLPTLVGDPDCERLFLREATIAAQVSHPNICSVYDFGEGCGVLYKAMQWGEGRSLREMLRAGGPLDHRLAARITADACGALHAAHELTETGGRSLHPVHLDVSPENILVSVAGATKRTDFGIARLLTEPSAIHSSGAWIRGKAGYMSPEQAAGEPVDRRSDVFSAGRVLYEATTGTPPFAGRTFIDVIGSALRGRVDPPTKHVRGYPLALERVVLCALARNPDLRFDAALAMQGELERWLVTIPVATHSEIGECGARTRGRAHRRDSRPIGGALGLTRSHVCPQEKGRTEAGQRPARCMSCRNAARHPFSAADVECRDSQARTPTGDGAAATSAARRFLHARRYRAPPAAWRLVSTPRRSPGADSGGRLLLGRRRGFGGTRCRERVRHHAEQALAGSLGSAS